MKHRDGFSLSLKHLQSHEGFVDFYEHGVEERDPGTVQPKLGSKSQLLTAVLQTPVCR